MAKYIAAPWGLISGKLGEAVGRITKWGGVVVAYREHVNSKATLQLLAQFRDKQIEKENISLKTVNVQFIIKLIFNISKQNYNTLVFPVWKETANKHQYTPLNAFSKENHLQLLNSIPDRTQLCDTENNPDIGKLTFTPYASGPPIPVTSTYNPKTGELKINWENPEFLNLNPEDNAYIVTVYFKPKPIILWTKQENPWDILKSWNSSLNPVVIRKSKTASLQIDDNLNPEFLFAYLFFKNKNNSYSKTYSVKPVRMSHTIRNNLKVK